MPSRKPQRKPPAAPPRASSTEATRGLSPGPGTRRRRPGGGASKAPAVAAAAAAEASAPAPASPPARSKKKIAHTRRLQAARKAADQRLERLPNVVGSCFSLKRTKGVATDQLSYTLLVSHKPDARDLADDDLIPPTVTRLGVQMPTDVHIIGPLRREAGFAIDDGTQVGTVGAFARGAGGLYYALTCAHCIGGPDGNIHTPDPIRIEYPQRFGPILPLGISADAEMTPGTGLQPDFGEFDAAIAHVTAPTLLQHVQGRPALPVFQPDPALGPDGLSDLLYRPVQGWGAAANGILHGQIQGVMVHVQGQYFDLMIGDPAGQGLTTVGDSGLLWIGPFGQAYGLHMAGDGVPGSPSPHAFACFAHRPVTRFALTLLSP